MAMHKKHKMTRTIKGKKKTKMPYSTKGKKATKSKKMRY